MERTGPTRLRLVVLIVGLLVAVLLGDWFMRHREMDSLLDQVEVSEKAMVTGRDALTVITNTYAGRLRTASNSGERDRAIQELTRDMERQASLSAAEVIAAGTYVADVSILPWHHALRRARDRYVLHSKEWEAHFTAASTDAKAWFENQPRISATFQLAEKAFRDATPARSLFGIDQRIDRVFQE